MKSFSLLKIAVIGLGFAAVLVFTPSCRAQSEVSPDHFDGTDSWETAARTPAPHALHSAASKNQLPSKNQLAPKNQLAKTKAASAQSTLQLASDRQRSAAQRPDGHTVVATQDKRKPTIRKPEKQ